MTYEEYETIACDLCESCDYNSKEVVTEGLNGVSKIEYPFCSTKQIHMIWLKRIFTDKSDCCCDYKHGGIS